MGENIYNDYTVDMNTGTVTNGKSYMPGIGFDDPSLPETPAYLGADLIGTTRRISGTSPGGTGASPLIRRNVLTAFGEPLATVGSSNTRYTYASRFGYETPEQSYDPLQELGWLHVGARYYDPAVGRFMQRDPIGIRGGLNTYEYVNSGPIENADLQGLEGHDTGTMRIIYRDAISSGMTHEQATRFIAYTNGAALVAGCAGAILLSPEIAEAAPLVRRLRVRLHVDPAHHSFPHIGKTPHIQVTVYLKGLKGSHVNIRIPIPPSLYEKIK